MLYDEKLLELLSRIPALEWEGEVYRHMFANFPPDQENTSGARWNSPEVATIYTSLSREVVLAEAEYQMEMQPRRPKARRTVYKIGVRLSSVLDISEPKILEALSLSMDALASLDYQTCQMIGSSAEMTCPH